MIGRKGSLLDTKLSKMDWCCARSVKVMRSEEGCWRRIDVLLEPEKKAVGFKRRWGGVQQWKSTPGSESMSVLHRDNLARHSVDDWDESV